MCVVGRRVGGGGGAGGTEGKSAGMQPNPLGDTPFQCRPPIPK